MKLSTTQTIEHEIEINLPCYVRYGDHYTKIIDEHKLLVVDNYVFCRKIELTVIEHNKPFGNPGYHLITEQEFETVLNSVYEELSKHIPALQTLST